tara:strand:+ start:90183 stop:90434 length:252 start_codon:yes stop_codon:yes gene_type:complete
LLQELLRVESKPQLYDALQQAILAKQALFNVDVETRAWEYLLCQFNLVNLEYKKGKNEQITRTAGRFTYFISVVVNTIDHCHK